MTGCDTEPVNVLLVGVGGQGVLLASDVLALVAMESNLDTKKSEVHGMSQRGGVVSSHVRFGEKVWSPIIPEGRADVLVAFEQAEALRALHLVSPNGKVISSTQAIVPPVASAKNLNYPADALDQVKESFPGAVCLDALDECRTMGNEKMVSVMLLGALAAQLEFPEPLWERVIRSRVPKGTESANLAAFQRGRELALGKRASKSGIGTTGE